jgi:hypothetical protein
MFTSFEILCCSVASLITCGGYAEDATISRFDVSICFEMGCKLDLHLIKFFYEKFIFKIVFPNPFYIYVYQLFILYVFINFCCEYK